MVLELYCRKAKRKREGKRKRHVGHGYVERRVAATATTSCSYRSSAQLFKYAQKHYHKPAQYAGKFALIAHNYTKTLFNAGRYDDAIDVAEQGRKICVKYTHYQFLPGLLDFLGGCYFYKRELEKCKEYYRTAHCLYKITGNDRDRVLLEEAAKRRLNQKFPFNHSNY